MQRSTKPIRWGARRWAALLAMAVVIAGCGGPNSAYDATASEPPPPEQSAREALEALETTPEQDDRLLALVGKLAIVLSKTGKARRAFTDELLQSLRRGRVDRSVIDPLQADFEQAIRDAMPQVLAALDELHQILTPAQRAKLIEGLAARTAASEQQRKARNRQMLDELDIGFVQKVRIGQALADGMKPLRPALAQLKLEAEAAGEAFERDDFDATELAIAQRDLGKLYLESVVVLVSVLAPELEHEQRTKLAGIIKHRLTGAGRHR